jgi:hypothetical protein
MLGADGAIIQRFIPANTILRHPGLWYDCTMTPKISQELRQALATQPGQPLQVEDPDTHARYVVVQLEVFERQQHAMDYDATEPNPREFYPAFAETVKDDLNAPGYAEYDANASLPKQS